MGNVLTANTTVLGFFEEVEIAFSVGDCVRTDSCIKVHNIRKIDDEHISEIPTTLCLYDKRLTVQSISKKSIRNYFIRPAIVAVRSDAAENKDRPRRYYDKHIALGVSPQIQKGR